MAKIEGLLNKEILHQFERASFIEFKKYTKDALEFYGVEAEVVPVDSKYYSPGAIAAATKAGSCYYILYMSGTNLKESHKTMDLYETAWHEATHVALWSLDENTRENLVDSIYDASKRKLKSAYIKNADYLKSSFDSENKEEVVCEMASTRYFKKSCRIVRALIRDNQYLTDDDKRLLIEHL